MELILSHMFHQHMEHLDQHQGDTSLAAVVEEMLVLLAQPLVVLVEAALVEPVHPFLIEKEMQTLEEVVEEDPMPTHR
jgi:hypothetical protein